MVKPMYITLSVSKETLKQFEEFCEKENRKKSNMFEQLVTKYQICRTCPFNHDDTEIKKLWNDIIKVLKQNNKKK